MRNWRAITVGCVLSLMVVVPAMAEEIGQVSTTFKFLGANDKIVIEAFDDPDISGATCYVSRAKTGGVKGAIGVAEDTSDASISCRQTGPITLPESVASGKDDGKEVFKKSASLLFKKVQVVRFFDKKRSTLVYLTYSDRIIEGSPKNSLSTIVLPQAIQGKGATALGN
ncbi:CreA family protein [Desulfobulbus propionicus DSM 2032]|uniref:CreA family protein n=1 Tax=Desulfobulbus propionicus (strain ATCC 33891 / DSM 2032 / VKM B-1956 / 1pr3) TaxID=577650 RepID=A0A7U3YN54_DESPD|nr:CreA family protein [Desulfobulbus propionicus]ADW18453.1 CreA family protein [Desulfobulbus propionicus DSM 2032]